MLGAALMGVLSLVRVPPKTASITFSSVTATAYMMLAPTGMRPVSHVSVGPALLNCAIAVQLIGMTLSLGARIYLGRRFGLLPANRGIVSGGPFRLVRHPIYLGWFVLSMGFVMAYPALLNIALLISILPVMVWRIALEEQLLGQDPAYRAYRGSTRYRVIPFVY
jgi:protein-S-isoprenylcysteine O-methyltransferase Ste14